MFKVLIADDERMVRLNLRTMIERDSEGFQVVSEAKDGEQALQLCLEHKPDLVITDIRMPGIAGLELIRRLSEQNLNLEYLVVSGYSDFQYAQSALRYGVADYLLKPIDHGYFLSVLRKINTRLYSKSRKPTVSKEWVWPCKVHAEQTAKAIWHLNEPELQSELDWIHEVLPDNQASIDPMTTEQVDYFIVVLNGALQELNTKGLPIPQVHRSAQVLTNSALLHSIQSSFLSLFEHIRVSRNWWSYNRLFKGAKLFIQDNYRNANLSLKDAAAHLELSSNYFGNMFKKEAGVSFNQYLTQLRIENAKALLLDPLTKLYEIGEEVGFNDYTYFSRIFKKHTGFSPSEYRKNETITMDESHGISTSFR